MKLSRILLAAGIVFATASCTPEMAVAPAKSIEEATFASSLGITLANFTKSSTGLYTQDVTLGNGSTAASGNHVTVHYTGYFTSGTSERC